MADEAMRAARHEGHPIIAIDERFDHARDDTCATISAIDIVTNKVVHCECVLRATQFDEGNFDGPAGGMEIAGVKRLILEHMPELNEGYYVLCS